MSQIQRSPEPPSKPGIANYTRPDYIPLYFSAARRHPTLGLVAVLRTAQGDELTCRPDDALLSPDIDGRLTTTARQQLAGLLLYGME